MTSLASRRRWTAALCWATLATGCAMAGESPDARAGVADAPIATDARIDAPGGLVDAALPTIDAPPAIDALIKPPSDAGDDLCDVGGAPGHCIDTASCAALGDHTPFSGHCPGPDEIQCCIVTPDVNDNPAVPTGYRLMLQAEVTPDMTAWAVSILHDTTTYPMFATTTMTFGAVDVLARVEWHPPDFLNSLVHRGVTLYTLE